MHMHAAQHVALPNHLERFHHGLVALLRTPHSLAPASHGVGACCQDDQAMLGCRLSRAPSQLHEFKLCIGNTHMRACGHLQLGLQKFAMDPRSSASINMVKERRWALIHHLQASGVGYKVLLLDAKAEPRVSR
jgi:hypothetical protein